MSEYTPRNPDAYYGHPLGADLMKGAAYAPYFDSAGRFLVGRIVEEVIDSKWLAQHDAEVERAAAEKAEAERDAALSTIAAIEAVLPGPRTWAESLSRMPDGSMWPQTVDAEKIRVAIALGSVPSTGEGNDG